MKLTVRQTPSLTIRPFPFFGVILATILTAILTPVASAEEARPATPPLSAEKTILVTVTAKVEAIDQDKRQVTLKGSLGNVITFIVDQRVKRLDEVKVGDDVTADYYVSLAGEVRAPTENEKKHPLTIVEGGARAPESASPAAGGLRLFKVVATVIGLDLPTRSVTLEGPLGNSGTIRVEQLEKLRQLRLGDTVIITYTEALAVSLQKSDKKKD
jgi:hypothetical protein